MRRYIESAARFFRLRGFVVNLTDGAVFGETWTNHDERSLHQFRTWIRGEWPEVILTNVKPTPIGTAYPAKARVESCHGVWGIRSDEEATLLHRKLPETFVMVRGDEEATVLISARTSVIQLLRGRSTDSADHIETTAWPEWKIDSH